MTAQQAYKDRQRRWLKDYKETRGCQGCHTNLPAALLDFHHRDPRRKRFNIMREFVNYGWRALRREVRKCDVLCVTCHPDRAR